MPRITTPFTITSHESAEQTPWAGAVPALGRATLRKTYTGPLEGEAVVVMLTCVADPADMARGAVYTALEQVVGRLDGRDGSFVMQHGATMGGAAAHDPVGTIAPGSGTGSLAGIRGTVEIHQGPDGHTLVLDYDFEAL